MGSATKSSGLPTPSESIQPRVSSFRTCVPLTETLGRSVVPTQRFCWNPRDVDQPTLSLVCSKRGVPGDNASAVPSRFDASPITGSVAAFRAGFGPSVSLL